MRKLDFHILNWKRRGFVQFPLIEYRYSHPLDVVRKVGNLEEI